MKKIFLCLVLLFGTTYCIVSCGSSDSNKSDTAATESEANADINDEEEATTTDKESLHLGEAFAAAENLLEKDDESEEVKTSSKSSNDWDKVLDEYEEYVNSYIRLAKKAQDGDLSAMSEYATMLEKTERLSNKLERADDEMTDGQMRRYLKITEKMTNAL